MERFHDILEDKLVVSVRENIVLIMPKKANCQFARTNIVKLFNTPIYRCEFFENRMIKTVEYTISQFDFDFINHIKEMRIIKKISQEQLSKNMGLARSFVGNVENINEKHKYSTRHIGLLAKAFGFKSVSELMKFPTPKNDKIKVIVKQIFNECGTKVISSEVVKIEEL